jgi:hypothetical protein
VTSNHLVFENKIIGLYDHTTIASMSSQSSD